MTFSRLAVALLCALPLASQAQIRATTDDGKRVQLLPDGTWKYETAVRPSSPAAAARRKSAAATTRVAVPFGDALFWMDGARWKEQSREGGRVVFIGDDAKSFGMIVSEGLGGVPTSSMKNVALTNAKKLDPNARVVFEERRVINGRELLYLEMDVTGQGIPFRFTGYYHGGTKSNLQVIGYTVRGEIEATRKGLEEFINGIEIREPSAPEPEKIVEADPGQLSYGNFTLKFDPEVWKADAPTAAGTWQLASRSGEAYAKLIAEKYEIPIDSLQQIALDKMKEQDPKMRLVSQREITVSGVRVRELQIDTAPGGIPVTFLGYYYGGKGGAVQLLTWSAPAEFATQRALLQSLLDGLVINVPN